VQPTTERAGTKSKAFEELAGAGRTHMVVRRRPLASGMPRCNASQWLGEVAFAPLAKLHRGRDGRTNAASAGWDVVYSLVPLAPVLSELAFRVAFVGADIA
jgi:hypothetical protein